MSEKMERRVFLTTVLSVPIINLPLPDGSEWVLHPIYQPDIKKALEILERKKKLRDAYIAAKNMKA